MADKQLDDATMEKMVQETEALVNASLKNAEKLLNAVVNREEPFEGFVVITLALAVLAKSMDMPRSTVLEGVGAAFDSLEEVGPYGIQ